MARASFGIVLLVLLCVSALTYASRPVADVAKRGNRVLVVFNRDNEQQNYSTFLRTLKTNGFVTSVSFASDQNLHIEEFGEYLFDHIVLLGVTSDEIGQRLNAALFVNYLNRGGNLLVVGNSQTSELIREVASQCGIEYDANGSTVVDHFHYVPELDGGKHTVIYSDEIQPNKFVFPSAIQGSIISEGIAVALSNNPLVFDLLRAESTAYASAPGKPIPTAPFAVGKLVSLASAIQARNNARAVFAGSVDLFSDRFINAKIEGKATGNEAFIAAVTNWVFQKTGVLRISNAQHHRAGESSPLSWYRIKDDMVYEVDIHQRVGDQWLPYKADDVQMEAIMLDPYLRVGLTHDNKGNFTAEFKLPDVYGMFTLRVAYFRRGASHIEIADIISVRPFRHNEYERFIVAAYPYYTASFAMMASVVVFSFVFLYHREPRKTEATKTKTN